ncbi:F-box/kelch-repeat protein At3g06240-like [Argentina anserina]|uniref:F-box/kelch-repeat protein At3g06240-like n=1 Tax=Argentina anserina TaxID=57926 RepID=UPI0021762E4A|nr:F-box/kelch-repeat protein At3g06240-like [Potentilla anserina]
MSEGGSGGISKRAHTELFDGDIISEILARLPVKPLMRFRCVSKSWNGLISDPYFTKKHLRYSDLGITESTSRVLYTMDPPQSLDQEALKDLKNHSDGYFANRKLDIPVLFPRGNHSLLGICNGLICILVQENSGFQFMLWNPCTKYFKMFPKYLCELWFCGFGYDSATDDYKVIVWSGMCKDETPIHVFSLRASSWKVLPSTSFRVCGRHGAYLNGALHWIEENRRTILSFDLEEEKFHDMIPLPDADIKFHSLRVVENCLCLFNHTVHQDVVCTIWLMKEYGVKQSWTQVIRCLRKDFPEGYRHVFMQPICFLESGEVLINDLCARLLVLYDPVEKTFKNVTRRADPYGCGALIYRETLVSPVTDNVAGI